MIVPTLPRFVAAGRSDYALRKGETMNEQTQRLAVEFSRILREWLTEELAEVVRLNAAEPDKSGVCHSHDYCDANQAMLDAWEVVFGKGEVPACIREHKTDAEENHDDAIWNAAWTMAKEKGFSL